jgi:hypothetical protein
MSVNWVTQLGELPDGPSTVTVRAVDRLGHLAEKTLEVTTQGDTTEPEVSFGDPVNNPDGSTDIPIHAVDTPDGSGATHVEFYIDGELINQFDQPCQSAPCPAMDVTGHIPAGQTLATSRATALADDQYGNTGQADTGAKTTFTRFGFNDEFARSAPDLLDAATEARATVLRLPADWSDIEKTQDGTRDWDSLDTLMARLPDNVSVILVAIAAPPWAYGNDESNGGAPTPPDAQHLDDWQDFVGRLATRYGPQLAAIEAWNEPNKATSWRGGPKEDFHPEPELFATLVRKADQGVANSTHPDVHVMAGGLSPQGSNVSDYLHAAFSNENSSQNLIRPDDVNGISVHLYVRNEEYRDNHVRMDLRDTFDTVSNYFANKPAWGDDRFWVTEIGLPSGSFLARVDNATSIANQRRRMLAAYSTFLRQEVAAFIIHRVADVNEATENDNFGVLNQDRSVKGSPPPNTLFCKLRALQPPVSGEGSSAHSCS